MTSALLETARRLVKSSSKKPRQADLKRAVSTAYYALFHAMAGKCADSLVGTGSNASKGAWAHAYRALDHGFAKAACGQLKKMGFPPTVCFVGDAFVALQQDRHEADYDPAHRVLKTDAVAAIALAEKAIADLDAAPRKDRVAFAIQLLLKKRP